MYQNFEDAEENQKRIKALKKILQTRWAGTTRHDTLGKCLTALNLDSTNSGWYLPKATKINGLHGIYMINESGTIFCEARIIKESEKSYLIEYMTTSGWNDFEKEYSLL